MRIEVADGEAVDVGGDGRIVQLSAVPKHPAMGLLTKGRILGSSLNAPEPN